MKQTFLLLLIICTASVIFSQPKVEKTVTNWNFEISFPQISDPLSKGEMEYNEIVRLRFYTERDKFLLKLKELDAIKDFSFDFDLKDTVLYSDGSFISVNCYGSSAFLNYRILDKYSFSINYDLKNNREVLLTDIYSDGYLKILSDYCINELVKQKSEFNEFVDKNNSMLIECAGPDEKNYRVFNPTKDGILFSFITYSVNNVMRTPVYSRVMVPYSLLKNYLKPDVKISLFVN